MNNIHSLTTERLVLRRWTRDDLDPYTQMCCDPKVMRWIGSGTTRDREACASAIAKFEDYWERNGYGLFAVELLETQRFIGFAGLATPDFLPEVMPSVEIGWRFAQSAWGKGYATEAAKAALTYAFESANIDRLVSIHQVGNEASGNIMQKLGMVPYLETIDPSCGRPVKVYEVQSS